jgi:hypothetical protein
MGRNAVARTVFVLAALVGGDAPAHADTPPPLAVEHPDPPLSQIAHPCCLRGEYRARTQFVTEMLRSVEGM